MIEEIGAGVVLGFFTGTLFSLVTPYFKNPENIIFERRCYIGMTLLTIINIIYLFVFIRENISLVCLLVIVVVESIMCCLYVKDTKRITTIEGHIVNEKDRNKYNNLTWLVDHCEKELFEANSYLEENDYDTIYDNFHKGHIDTKEFESLKAQIAKVVDVKFLCETSIKSYQNQKDEILRKYIKDYRR